MVVSLNDHSKMKNIKELESIKGSLLYIEGDGYYFSRTKVRGNKVYLKCNVDSCPVRGKTDKNLTRPIEYSHNSHTHPPNPYLPDVLKVRKKILHRCETEFTPIKTIYKQETARASKEVTHFLPYRSLNSTMRKRRKYFMDYRSHLVANAENNNINSDSDEDPLVESLIEIIELDEESAESEGTTSFPPSVLSVIAQDSASIQASHEEFATNENPPSHISYQQEEIFVVEIKDMTNKCIVCRTDISTVMCVPCGHICMCRRCRMAQNPDKCPFCQTVLSPFLEI